MNANVQWLERQDLDQIITDHIERVDVVLDIGCGIRPQAFFRPRLHICCEPHPEYVTILQNRFEGLAEVLILQGTAQEVLRVLPDASVDSVFMVDVIEHMDADVGRSVLLESERVARKQVVLFTPLGFMPQEYDANDIDGWGLGGAERQVHRSGWTPDDFDESWDILASKAYHLYNGKGEESSSPFGAFWAIKTIDKKETRASSAKLAVLSHILPPSPSGQAMVLYRLLREWSPEDYILLSQKDYDPYLYVQNAPTRLPAQYHHVPAETHLRGSSRFTALTIADKLLQVLKRARYVAHIIKRERCSAIVACSGDALNIPVGYLASRWSRVPFFAYMFDDYVYQWTGQLQRFVARITESLVLKKAAGVIVPNEFLREEYQHRYQIKPTIIRNPSEVSKTKQEDKTVWPACEGKVKIVYTGAVYHAHYDAFRNLVAAIKQLNQLCVDLHLYTAQPRLELQQRGICGPVTYHPHVAPSLVSSIQQEADILFLPLAFDSPISEVIRTSSPGKLGEYLASERPVLVHAPADSFVSWYFRKHRCGVVVDTNDSVKLAHAIRRIVEDADLRRMIVHNAGICAATDFGVGLNRAEFARLFRPDKGA